MLVQLCSHTLVSHSLISACIQKRVWDRLEALIIIMKVMKEHFSQSVSIEIYHPSIDFLSIQLDTHMCQVPHTYPAQHS